MPGPRTMHGRSSVAAKVVLFTPACADDFDTETDWFIYLQNLRDPSVCYQVELEKSKNVHCIRHIQEGTGYRAWYPLSPSTWNAGAYGVGGNTRYWNMATSDVYIEWDVEAEANGHNTLLVNVVGVAGAGTLDCIKNYGTTDQVTLGTADTANAGTDYRLIRTIDITGNELQDGDKIRFRWTSTESNTCRLSSRIWSYDTKQKAVWGEPYYIPTLANASIANSGMELAYQMAPAGSALRYVGSWAHQGSSTGYGTETNVVESWSRDGSAYTPTRGWVEGEFALSRTCDVDYDEGPHVLGSLAYTYRFANQAIDIEHLFTASTGLDLGTLNAAMYAWQSTNASVQLSSTEHVTGPNDNSFYPVGSTTRESVSHAQGKTAGGYDARITRLAMSHTLSALTVWAPASYDKIYWQLSVGSTAAATDAWGGRFKVDFR